jgi:hypothetical protein
MVMAFFWVVAPGSPVEVNRRSEVLSASIFALTTEAASIFETLVNF